MAKQQQRAATKGGKKGSKRKVIDPFLRKEWYALKAPSTFDVRTFGHTIVTKSQGTKLATDGLKGRVYEVNMADLTRSEENNFRKVKLSCEEVKNSACLTDFHGLDTTRDKICSLIRKRFTLIEASVDVKTADGYTLRVFPIAFTARRVGQHSETCYAQSAQIRTIRKKMTETLNNEVSKLTLRNVVKKFTEEKLQGTKTVGGFGQAVAKAASTVFPLQNVLIRKVKVLKKPKLDIVKLMELHNDSVGESRNVVSENEAAKNLVA
eukprot:GDKH01013482.1.p2 GENE.GDKH01013482.1~~GDKH01013482.1.p2  ORF type:complete len:273 (+),score=50.23 GDKH01013482.1:27-821(+)